MPRVKIEYIVSFSSEDPEHPARNLLSGEAGGRAWLTARGERSRSASVVLQLARAVKVSSLVIGGTHAALVEVLAGRSEAPEDEYKVVVPRSVFLSPAESRGGRARGRTDRVRSYSGHALGDAAAQRWDRLRVICDQPYDKHEQFGLSFVHVFTDEGGPHPPPQPAILSLAPALTENDSTEQFTPGSLFAMHKRERGKEKGPANVTDIDLANTDAQIRQATSRVLKNVSESSGAKLVRSPRPFKTTLDRDKTALDQDKTGRDKNTSDRDETSFGRDKHMSDGDKSSSGRDRNPSDRDKVSSGRDKNTSNRDKSSLSRDKTRNHSRDNHSGSHARDEQRQPAGERRKRERDEASSSTPPKRPCTSSSQPLRGVIFALSGYENPHRAVLRGLATSLGAHYCREADSTCTHLICAFPNTPKLKALRAAGSPVIAVTGRWVEACAAKGARLPWRGFATDPKDREGEEEGASDECDTDDEIQRVTSRLRDKAGTQQGTQQETKEGTRQDTQDWTQQETRKGTQERTQRPICSPGDPRRDENDESQLTGRAAPGDDTDDSESYNVDTDTEVTREEEESQWAAVSPLPPLFSGRTLAVGQCGPLDGDLLGRYIVAYGGQLVQGDTAETAVVDYLVCAGGSERRDAAAGARERVRGEWVWRCHEAGALLATDKYTA